MVFTSFFDWPLLLKLIGVLPRSPELQLSKNNPVDPNVSINLYIKISIFSPIIILIVEDFSIGSY
ncbi:hypothetical protein [Nostoc sp. CCY 9925]|uniref:hypothetical protein n=1 Tax=Nostoc sp. CCY 9925 TaxID=3103865 RepID=UPI0039C5DE56